MPTTSQLPVYKADFLTDTPYQKHVASLHDRYPHLEALSLYMEAIDRERLGGHLGSHDSDSILVMEAMGMYSTQYYRINCYDSEDVKKYQEVISRRGDPRSTKSRVIVVEDLSPAAIEVLGSSFNLDPHVFYHHLGFETRQSALAGLVDPEIEKSIPVAMCSASHVPVNFYSVPLPCDLKSTRQVGSIPGLGPNTTYSRQVYQPMVRIEGSSKAWDPPQRAFHRLSIVIPDSGIETGKCLQFDEFSIYSLFPLC